MMTTAPEASGRLKSHGAGYDGSRLNAVRCGVLSRYSVLPGDDEAEHQSRPEELIAEHAPAGATEVHLVVELLAWPTCYWRSFSID